MKRRCKAGQRARIVDGPNNGVIVMILRPYFGEHVEEAIWPEILFPWVVVSLGPLLRAWFSVDNIEAPPGRMCVVDDRDLVPLDDDEERDRETSTVRPVGERVS